MLLSNATNAMTHCHPTALRSTAQQELQAIERADILVGIPCFNNAASIAYVIQQVSQGLATYYPDHRAVLLIADGESTDDTRKVASDYPLLANQEKVVTCYQGISGKGSALRAIFEAAYQLEAQGCATLDADLRSITPEWIRVLLDPVLGHGYGYVTPVYARYKYDGTITNNIVYNLTRALYGKQIRQPIGGDFAFSQFLAQHFLMQPVWQTDVARFGIDIWMTLTAIVQRVPICQVNLGAKIHDAKDPAAALGPMFQQVCGTLFSHVEQHPNLWMTIKTSDPVPMFGRKALTEPEPIHVDQRQMVQSFKGGMERYGDVYDQLLSEDVSSALHRAGRLSPVVFEFPSEIWVKLLYEFIAAYHHLPHHRRDLLTWLTPLYLGRVASFITQTREMSFTEAEAEIEGLAQLCEQQKPYLLEVWKHPTRLLTQFA